jgi:hypothetical protein
MMPTPMSANLSNDVKHRARRRARAVGWLLGSVLTVAAGCTPWATYPPIEGAAGINNPELNPIPEVMAVSIREMHERDGASGPIVFNLPAGMPERLYHRVAKLIGAGARPMMNVGEQAYHVCEVRVRGTEAEVDIVHPGPGGSPRLATVACRPTMAHGFEPRSVRPYRFVVDEPLLPNYPGAAAQGDWPGADGAAETSASAPAG